MQERQLISNGLSVTGAFDAFDSLVLKLSKLGLAAMFLMISFNAISRHVFSFPIKNTLALTELYFMPLVVVLAFSYVRREAGNVRVDLLSRNFPDWVNGVIEILADLVVAGILLLIINEYADFTMSLTDRGTTSTGGLPTYLSHWIIVLGLSIFVMRLLLSTAQNVRTLR